MASGGGNRLTRDEFKKAKELEEARKAGTLPAELDEDGREINPHIPQYIAQAPWYLNRNAPSLKHQRKTQETEQYDKEWYDRGATKGPAATKFRKGACTNCGAMTHTAKFCCERPRKLGAKFTGKDIKPDEVVKSLSLDFDGTRDRWNGYDPEMYKEVEQRYEFIEQERRKKKKEEELKGISTEKKAKGEESADSDIDSDDDSHFERQENQDFLESGEGGTVLGQKKDSKTRTTIRNLRIREDTAKYLRNLDPNSAYYDPKSRSMRDNPNPDKKLDELTYAGDNFERAKGDIKNFYDAQLFAWDASNFGQQVHLQGAPSQAELTYKEFQKKKEHLKSKTQTEIIAKYGGADHLVDPSADEEIKKTVFLAQSEAYVEYSTDGSLVGQSATSSIPKSKYDEDVFIHNHTSIWGSFWDQGRWGYKCCHQFVKNSYCTGEKGIALHQDSKKALQVSSSSNNNNNATTSTIPLSKKDEEKQRKARLEKALDRKSVV